MAPPLPLPHSAVGVMLAIAACTADTPADTPQPQGRAPSGIEVFAQDMSRHPLDAVPHWPVIRIDGVGASEATDAATWLLEGSPTAALHGDLVRKPLTQRHAGMAVPGDVSSDGFNVWLVPREPLKPGGHYTLALAAWLSQDPQGSLPLPLAVGLRAKGADGGARLIGSLPASGQAGVPADLDRVVVAFSGITAGCRRLRLMAKPGGEVAARITSHPCAALDDRADLCCALQPTHALSVGGGYEVRFDDLQGPLGAPVAGEPVDFSVAAPGHAGAPAPAPLACAVDEVATGPGLCALPYDNSIVLRLRLEVPSVVHLEHAQTGTSMSRLVGAGELALPFGPLPAATEHTWALRLTGVGGSRGPVGVRARTTTPLPTVSITEVRADPLGREPDQEYVELWNYGPEPVDVSGFALADAIDSLGSIVAPTAALPPGARLLLVADGFAADAEQDVPTPPGARLLRMGRALASKGLSNAGEPLYLRDAIGRRLSGAPSAPRPRPGICVVRRGDDPRSGHRDDFDYDPNSTCTPGRAP